jgi:hypothetical protein
MPWATAVDLALDDQRVDEIPRIVHGDELEERGFSCLSIHLHHRDVAAERIRVVARLEECFFAQARLETRWQRHRDVGECRDLSERLA